MAFAFSANMKINVYLHHSLRLALINHARLMVTTDNETSSALEWLS